MVTLLTPVCKYINPPQSYVKGNWPQRFVYVVNLLHNAVKLDLFTSTVGTDVDQPQWPLGELQYSAMEFGVYSFLLVLLPCHIFFHPLNCTVVKIWYNFIVFHKTGLDFHLQRFHTITSQQ